METLALIRTELRRQHDISRGTGLGCFDDTRPNDALIDGRVDLVQLAYAIDTGKRPHVEKSYRLSTGRMVPPPPPPTTVLKGGIPKPFWIKD
jgi:hypothetical protein